MKITDVNIPKDYPTHDGLETIQMFSLGQIVLVAGRNGSGKSRLLEKIAKTFRTQASTDNIAVEKALLSKAQENVRRFEEKIKHWANPAFNPTIKGEERAIRVTGLIQMKKKAEETVSRKRQLLDQIFLGVEGDAKARDIIHFVPKQLNLEDPKNLRPKDLERRSVNANSLGIQNINENALPKIQDLHQQYLIATHQNTRLRKDQTDTICAEYRRLQSTLKKLIGASLGGDDRGAATLFDFPIGEARLSLKMQNYGLQRTGRIRRPVLAKQESRAGA